MHNDGGQSSKRPYAITTLTFSQVGRALVAGVYEELYQRVQQGQISMAKHWLEITKIREHTAARARGRVRNHRMEQFWRKNYELDPDKHTYSIDSVLDFRDRAVDTAALRRLREMEWSRTDGLLAAIPIYEGGDPLEDPMIENFLQRVFFDEDGSRSDHNDDEDLGMFDDDDMGLTDGYMTDASSLVTDRGGEIANADFTAVDEDLWTIEEEDDASLEDFETSGIDEVRTRRLKDTKQSSRTAKLGMTLGARIHNACPKPDLNMKLPVLEPNKLASDVREASPMTRLD